MVRVNTVSKEMIVTWIRDAWCSIDADLVKKSFDVCGINIHPLSNSQIYWDSLNSLKKDMESASTLPSLQSLFQSDLFNDTHLTPTTNMYIWYPENFAINGKDSKRQLQWNQNENEND